MSDRVLLAAGDLRPATLARLRPVAAAVGATLVIERRSGVERRALDVGPVDGGAGAGRDRRVGERRAELRALPLTGRLPVRLLPQRRRMRLVERRALPAELLADHDALRLLVHHADGDPRAAQELFEGWFDRAYAYLSGWLDDTRGAQAAAQATFLALLRIAPTLDVQRTSFRVLLVEELHAASGRDAVIAGPTARPAASPSGREDDGTLDRLSRLSSLDLYILLARLGTDDRRILMLRHVLKLGAADAARLLGLAPGALEAAERTALRRLVLEVQRIGGCDTREGERVPMRAFARISPVVRARRTALAVRV